MNKEQRTLLFAALDTSRQKQAFCTTGQTNGMQRLPKYHSRKKRRESTVIPAVFLLTTLLGGMPEIISPTVFAQTQSRHYVERYVDGHADVDLETVFGEPGKSPATPAPLPPAKSVSTSAAIHTSVSAVMPPQNEALPESISIIELQGLAEIHNPTLKILKSRIVAAQGEWHQAGRHLNPVLSYEGEEIGDGGKAGKHGVVLEQEIRTGGKRTLDRSIAAWETDARRKELRLRYLAVQNDIRARAYELLAAQQVAQIQESLAEIGFKSVEAAEELSKVGETSRIDLLQIRAKARESEAALRKARIDEELAWKKVATMVGQRDLPRYRISDTLETDWPFEDREAAWHYLESQSPKLAMARSRVQQARTVLARERAGQIPDIAVSGGFHYDFGEKQSLASVGVGVPLQIFDRNEGNVRKAQGELAAACGELNRLTLTLYEEFCDFYSALETSREQVDLYRLHILPDVREAMELSLKGYRQGEYGYMDVLSAQQSFLESQTQYIELLKSSALASIYLEGFLAQGGLDGIDD